MAETYWTSKRVARALSASARQVADLAIAGRLPAIGRDSIGRRLFDSKVILEYGEQRARRGIERRR